MGMILNVYLQLLCLAKIAIVFQEVTLFNTSILENIRIGNSQASDEEVKKAARLAQLRRLLLKTTT